MSKKFAFRLKELHSLHANLRVVLVLLLLLTACILAYMAVRVFVLTEPMLPTEFVSLCFFAAFCIALCVGQLYCLRRMRHDTREKIEQMTFVDELTEVFNYRYLEQRLGEELQRARRHGFPVSLVYLDLDGFKLVNDTYGHEAGNQVLRRVCETIRGHVRGEDFIGRLGGDEFLLVLPHTDASGALIAAERLRTKLTALDFTSPGGERIDFVGFSMGVASHPASGETREALVRAADEAMYRAKKSGGDRVCL
ncbi:MAG TPA: GGDEF domain-containing protein [Planctomycetota bacterium]|nr:GGDEF domain-containing protein [Planctomycetota bacterium]